MKRNEAIQRLAQNDLVALSREQRASVLLDWWFIDADDPDYALFPLDLKRLLSQSDQPDDPALPLYDPLLQLALEYAYKGVLNSYLSMRLLLVGIEASIEGEADPMAACPCCGYLSLPENGNYDICHVCFWEDDGTTAAESYSGPNHMTLSDARQNFRRLGAVTEANRQHVLPDGKERYGLRCKA